MPPEAFVFHPAMLQADLASDPFAPQASSFDDGSRIQETLMPDSYTDDFASGGGMLQSLQGAPPPVGCQAMRYSSEQDMRKAFEMLDTNSTGTLGRHQAKSWLRCMGWVLPDQQLEAMLSGEKKSGLSLVKLFTFRNLKEIVEQHAQVQNGSKQVLRDSLKNLASESGQLKTRYILDLAADPAIGLSAQEIQALLEVLGGTGKEALDIDDLAEALLDAVSNPPTAQELSAANVMVLAGPGQTSSAMRPNSLSRPTPGRPDAASRPATAQNPARGPSAARGPTPAETPAARRSPHFGPPTRMAGPPARLGAPVRR